jgi:hypothetical protein
MTCPATLGGLEAVGRAVPAGDRGQGAVQQVRDDSQVDAGPDQPFLDSLLKELLGGLVLYGAAPMAPARIAEALEEFGPVLMQGYGQTECLGMCTSLRKDEHDPERRAGLLASCGRPVAGAPAEALAGTERCWAPGRSARFACGHQLSWPDSGTEPRRRQRRWRAGGCTRGTWRSGTKRASSTWRTGRRT